MTEKNTATTREAIFNFLRRNSSKVILVGPVSLWLRGGYGLKETEAVLETLVSEGILRPATPNELAKDGLRHGYHLTDEGRKQLKVV